MDENVPWSRFKQGGAAAKVLHVNFFLFLSKISSAQFGLNMILKNDSLFYGRNTLILNFPIKYSNLRQWVNLLFQIILFNSIIWYKTRLTTSCQHDDQQMLSTAPSSLAAMVQDLVIRVEAVRLQQFLYLLSPPDYAGEYMNRLNTRRAILTL